METISVIVPIFGVEKYLPSCLDTLINQTYKDLDIILVDDGSKDNCPAICDEYATKDSRIRVIHKENGGLSSARNAGLKIAYGKYIAFVDSDDWLDINMYEELIKVLKETNAQVATCGIINVFEEGQVPTSKESGRIIIHDKESAYRGFLDIESNIRFEVWNKLYYKEVIGNYLFKEGQVYEDVYFERMIMHNVKEVATIDRSLYYYRHIRPGNTNSVFKTARFCVFSELKDFAQDLKEQGFYEVAKLYERDALETAVNFYVAGVRLNVNKDVFIEIKKNFKNFFKLRGQNKTMRRMKYYVFNCSPAIYYFIHKLRNFF